jgi:hypothetical protein
MDIPPICILMKMLKMEPEKRRRHLIRHWSIKRESIPTKLRGTLNRSSWSKSNGTRKWMKSRVVAVAGKRSKPHESRVNF